MKDTTFDIFSFIMGLLKGKKRGEGSVVIDSDTYIFVDTNNDGNIVVTEGDGE